MPRSIQELDARIQATRSAALADTGHEPTDDNLAAELGVPVARVREAAIAGQNYRSLLPVHSAGDETDPTDAGRPRASGPADP